MTSQKFFPYAKQSIDASDREAVEDSLKQERITRGPKTAFFEQQVAAACDVKWAVAFNSGSSALYAAFHAAKVSEKDRFITSPNSFIATVAAGMRQNARPHFVDIDRASGNLSLQELKPLLNEPLSRGRFIICPVHFSGIAVDMRKLDSMIKTPESLVIEDAAHALGSLYPTGEKVGSCAYSQMTIFSFHPAKTITTGEGGMVTTNDDELYHRLTLFRNSGIEREKPYLQGTPAPGYYEIADLCGNYHMTEMQAALGISQMKRLEAFTTKRRALVARYRMHLDQMPQVTLFSKAADPYTAYHLMCAQIDLPLSKTKKVALTKVALMNALHEAGIGTEVHYIPLYRHPALSSLYNTEIENFPQMEAYYSQELSLPLYYDLEEADVDFICATLKRLIG